MQRWINYLTMDPQGRWILPAVSIGGFLAPFFFPEALTSGCTTVSVIASSIWCEMMIQNLNLAGISPLQLLTPERIFDVLTWIVGAMALVFLPLTYLAVPELLGQMASLLALIGVYGTLTLVVPRLLVRRLFRR